jgi:hypothetical protein
MISKSKVIYRQYYFSTEYVILAILDELLFVLVALLKLVKYRGTLRASKNNHDIG